MLLLEKQHNSGRSYIASPEATLLEKQHTPQQLYIVGARTQEQKV